MDDLSKIQNFLLGEADRIDAFCNGTRAVEDGEDRVLPPLPGDISYSSFALNLRHWALQLKVLPVPYNPIPAAKKIMDDIQHTIQKAAATPGLTMPVQAMARQIQALQELIPAEAILCSRVEGEKDAETD